MYKCQDERCGKIIEDKMILNFKFPHYIMEYDSEGHVIFPMKTDGTFHTAKKCPYCRGKVIELENTPA